MLTSRKISNAIMAFTSLLSFKRSAKLLFGNFLVRRYQKFGLIKLDHGNEIKKRWQPQGLERISKQVWQGGRAEHFALYLPWC